MILTLPLNGIGLKYTDPIIAGVLAVHLSETLLVLTPKHRCIRLPLS